MSSSSLSKERAESMLGLSLGLVSRPYHRENKIIFFKWVVFFGCLFMIKTNVRKEVLAQNHFLPCKNAPEKT